MKSLLLTLSLVTALALTACSYFANESYTFPTVGGSTPITIKGFGAWCENNLSLIRASTKSTVTIGASIAAKNNGAKVAAVTAEIKKTEVVLQPLLNQGSISYADIDQAFSSISVNDPSGIYADAISPAITLIAGYVVELTNENAPSRVGLDVLTAVVNGLSDAVVALSA